MSSYPPSGSHTVVNLLHPNMAKKAALQGGKLPPPLVTQKPAPPLPKGGPPRPFDLSYKPSWQSYGLQAPAPSSNKPETLGYMVDEAAEWRRRALDAEAVLSSQLLQEEANADAVSPTLPHLPAATTKMPKEPKKKKAAAGTSKPKKVAAKKKKSSSALPNADTIALATSIAVAIQGINKKKKVVKKKKPAAKK